MPNKQENPILSGPFTTDPAVGLWTYIKAQWPSNYGYTPPAQANVKFDTKFGEFKGFYNFVIVENMPSIVKPSTIGAARHETTEIKRLQILCIGQSAKNNKWHMERHIEGIINANVTGMQTTYGIKTMQISDFTEIFGRPDNSITNQVPMKAYQTARSFATVELKYEQTQATV